MKMLLTGGSGSLGKILVKEFHEQMTIIVIDKVSYEESYFKDQYPDVDYYSYDFTNLDGIPKLTNDILKKHKKIEVLVNNAAIRRFKAIEEFSDLEIQEYISVNQTSMILLTKQMLRNMRVNGFGRIVNISSISAYHGYKAGALYCSTKAAMLRYCESVAGELADEDSNITINTIAPGSFQMLDGTKMPHYTKITNNICKCIVKLISNSKNGVTIPIISTRDRLMLAKRLLLKLISVP